MFLHLICVYLAACLPRSSYCAFSVCPGVGGDMKGVINFYDGDIFQSLTELFFTESSVFCQL